MRPLKPHYASVVLDEVVVERHPLLVKHLREVAWCTRWALASSRSLTIAAHIED